MKKWTVFLLTLCLFFFNFFHMSAIASRQDFSIQISRSKVAGVPGSLIQYKVLVRNQTQNDITVTIASEILETNIPLNYSIHRRQRELTNQFKLEKASAETLDVAIQTTEQTPIKTQGILRITFSSRENPASKQQALLYFYVVDEIVMHLKIGSNDVQVRNQDPFILDYPPYIKDSRTFVPLRFIGESFGATIGWDQRERKVTYTLRGKNLTLWINQTRYLVNGTEKRMDVAPEIKPPGRTFVPIRLISEELGASVTWLAENQQIRIEFAVSG